VVNPGVDGWLGPYLKSDKSLNDPWGHTIGYVLDADGATVTILGADGKTGGKGVDADLVASVK
jgi:general secretion pathway protein G